MAASFKPIPFKSGQSIQCSDGRIYRFCATNGPISAGDSTVGLAEVDGQLRATSGTGELTNASGQDLAQGDYAWFQLPPLRQSLPPPEWITADTTSGGLTITEDVLNSGAPVASSPEVEHNLIGTAPETTGPALSFPIGAFTGGNYPITLTIGEDNPPVLVKSVIALTSLGAISAPQARDGLAGDGTAGEAFEFTRSSKGVENINTADLLAGDYTMALVGIDKFGNMGAVATRTFTVASAAPAVTDDFNRADERLINGANWSRIYRTSGYVAISGNVAQAEGPNDYEAVRYDTPVDTDDHFAEIEVTISATGTANFVRVFASVVSLTEYYTVELNGDGRFRMWVRNSGGESLIQTVTGLTLVPNAVLRIEVEDVGGNQTIRGFYNGVEIHSEVNSDIPVARYCGFSIKAAQTSNIQVDNFTQGSL